MIDHKSQTAALLYSELLDQYLAEQHINGTGFSFVPKTKQDRKYWYLQHVLGDSRKQYYLGPETPELLDKIQSLKNLWQVAKVDQKATEKLVAAAVGAGCNSLAHPGYKVLKAAEQTGLFNSGGVVVGSFAFQAYGNMLGVDWDTRAMMTQDVDIAAGNECMVAVPGGVKPLKAAVMAADEGFCEVPMLNPKSPSTSFIIRQTKFRVDLVTPMHGATTSKPKMINEIKSYAQPIRFLDYLLEDTQKAVLLGKDGVLVNVPTPSRFALHKLVVAQRRPAAEHLKSKKDVKQAKLALEVLLQQRPGDLWLALGAAKEYPKKKFYKGIKQGVKLLPVHLQEQLGEHL